jgi:hypothetical protein
MEPEVDKLPDSSVVGDEFPVQQSEFVIDRIVGHGFDPDDNGIRVRVRWHGYSKEVPSRLPRSFVERNATKKRMKLNRFIQETD